MKLKNITLNFKLLQLAIHIKILNVEIGINNNNFKHKTNRKTQLCSQIP